MDEFGAMVGAYSGMAAWPATAIAFELAGASVMSLRSMITQELVWWNFG